ncbi:hypothetical protein ACOSQ3_031226 [Xanthoceras sorbifolium]
MEEIVDFGFVEREEIMVSPSGDGNPTMRLAHFLQPTVTTIDEPVFELPSNCISSVPPNLEPKNWPLEVKYNGWRNPQKEWKAWVEKMSSLHQSTWNTAGIREAIWSSTYKIQRNNDLILGLAEKWCPDTKSFIFSWGEATVTLEDLLVSGNSVLGSPFFRSLETQELKEVEEQLEHARKELNRSSSKKADHSGWMKKFMGSGSNIEHEAFLALWLSRFVFPGSFSIIGQAIFPIAVQLSRGTRIALAPAILASIYRDLGLLKQRIAALAEFEIVADENEVLEISICSPFQLVQLWAWERFVEFRPKYNLIKNGEPRCAQWHEKIIGVGNVRKVLDSAGVSFNWRPYAKTLKNWKLPQFYAEQEMFVSVDADLPEEFESFALCLRSSELVGLDCVEQYLPHRVAMQFGMDQDLPACVARANDTRHAAWSCYSKPITCANLYIPPRLYEADVTARYSKWWKQSMLGLKHECEIALLEKTFPSSTPGRSKAEKFSCFVGSKTALKIAKHNKEGGSSSSSKMEPKRLKRTESSSMKSTKVAFKRPDGMNEGYGTSFCSSSSLKSSKRSPKTSKQKKKDPSGPVTLGSPLKKAKKTVETSKGKERVCDVSASAGLSSKMLPPSLTVKKELNDSPVPPGFALKFNLVETRESVDEDDQTIAELLRSNNVKFIDREKLPSHSQNFSSSMADNEATRFVETQTELMDKIMHNECVKGDSGTVMEYAAESKSGSPDNDVERIRSSESGGNKHATELLELQFEDRVSRVERIFAELKAAKLAPSHPSKFTHV